MIDLTPGGNGFGGNRQQQYTPPATGGAHQNNEAPQRKLSGNIKTA